MARRHRGLPTTVLVLPNLVVDGLRATVELSVTFENLDDLAEQLTAADVIDVFNRDLVQRLPTMAVPIATEIGAAMGAALVVPAPGAAVVPVAGGGEGGAGPPPAGAAVADAVGGAAGAAPGPAALAGGPAEAMAGGAALGAALDEAAEPLEAIAGGAAAAGVDGGEPEGIYVQMGRALQALPGGGRGQFALPAPPAAPDGGRVPELPLAGRPNDIGLDANFGGMHPTCPPGHSRRAGQIPAWRLVRAREAGERARHFLHGNVQIEVTAPAADLPGFQFWVVLRGALTNSHAGVYRRQSDADDEILMPNSGRISPRSCAHAWASAAEVWAFLWRAIPREAVGFPWYGVH